MNKLHQYNGEQELKWNPELMLNFGNWNITKKYLVHLGSSGKKRDFYYVVENFLTSKSCQDLIEVFSQTEVHPVGVSGYQTDPSIAIGSYRANAWSPSLADQISIPLKKIISQENTLRKNAEAFENLYHEFIHLPVDYEILYYTGVTPFMRFMKYPSGGMHVPHYDAPFICKDFKYMTLFSWIIYLNTPIGSGGDFQFVNDHQWGIHPADRNKDDWKRMAKAEEILDSVSPREGRLLILPHWLPHQVSHYIGSPNNFRYIIRGDVAYEW